jgi:hypothetical protein
MRAWTPQLSVVLPVYNGAVDLAATLESILAQSCAEFELLAVDDGSTDETLAIMAAYAARDARIRVIRQANAGITQALIAGCNAVRAPLIVRHDCGDVSRPHRFQRMVDIFRADPSCVLAAGECDFVGPEKELLYTTRHATRDLRRLLLEADVREIVSLPAHGAAAMRTEAYRQAGGYRPEFYFAQDLDLWIRMATLGTICIDASAVYELKVSVGAISSLHRAAQVASARLAIALRETRDEARRIALLEEVARIQPTGRGAPAAEADAQYFIASCLRRRNDARWRRYATRALAVYPLHFRSWLLLLRGVLG